MGQVEVHERDSDLVPPVVQALDPQVGGVVLEEPEGGDARLGHEDREGPLARDQTPYRDHFLTLRGIRYRLCRLRIIQLTLRSFSFARLISVTGAPFRFARRVVPSFHRYWRRVSMTRWETYASMDPSHWWRFLFSADFRIERITSARHGGPPWFGLPAGKR